MIALLYLVLLCHSHVARRRVEALFGDTSGRTNECFFLVLPKKQTLEARSSCMQCNVSAGTLEAIRLLVPIV
jgi:hypothetical protein